MIKKIWNWLKSLKPKSEVEELLDSVCPICGAPAEAILNSNGYDPKIPFSLTAKRVMYKCGTVGMYKHGIRVYHSDQGHPTTEATHAENDK